MKLFVISDTHGKLDKVLEVCKKLTAVDLILHLGDCSKDAEELEKVLGIDVLSVKGNMDGSYSPSDYKILETECGKLYLAHGHMENVKATYQNIYYRAEECGCIAALFGHTHKPVFEEVNGIHLINPGSLSLPSDGTQGSYAIVHTSPEGLTGSIVYYSSIQKNKPQKVQGGYIRGLLNYSDRF
ncbi:metallophosphoesterase family protein [Clostridium aminobutyricum]|uniref:Phosphoesterase n=1 Tax=Clostridium aminobutyricum TaxID=33953 RepID=A0A939D8X8_CLOAM|nr:metallophosphoesterase [Clostridium aminobutyricum]MBN7772943.1 metallophosphoesterase [Clostridium aminobutyricum]